MAHQAPEAQAFLEIASDWRKWQLPEIYRAAIASQLYSFPTSFFLPWSPMLRHEEGEEIRLPCMSAPFEELTVLEVDYSYCKKEGVRIYIKVSTESSSEFNLHCLLSASEEGFLFENRAPIKHVLMAASLPATLGEYEALGGTHPAPLDWVP